jgi:predicted porin
MKHRKTQLAAAVGAALLVGGTAVQAQAPAAPANLVVQLYGQVNRALMWADDGHSNRIFHVDGQPSSTRFGIQGTSQIAPGLRAGARIETEMKSNPANAVNFGLTATSTAVPTEGFEGPSQTNSFAERWLDASLEGAWGRINIGQGSGASDDASTIDLSGTGIANGVCFCDWGGAIQWRTTAGGLVPATVEGTHNNQDFESRYDRAMYTTPVFGGLRAQAGFGQKTDGGEVTEASIWYSAKIAGELQAAIGWSEEKTGTATAPHNETIGGSISWLHSSGFNIGGAYTQADGFTVAGKGDTFAGKSKFWYGKVGFKFGTHAIAVHYGQHEDHALAGDEGKSMGVGYVWNPIRWAEIYAAYHLFQLDRTGLDVEDVTVALIGTRIRF